jgi:hypothetical protein
MQMTATQSPWLPSMRAPCVVEDKDTPCRTAPDVDCLESSPTRLTL